MPNIRFSSTRLIRSYNVATVLQTLYRHDYCSRSQLAHLTKISPATITRIVSELLEQGIILEGRQAQSTGGRKPVYLHLDYTKLYIISVQLLHDESVVALSDLRGHIFLKKLIEPSGFAPNQMLSEVHQEIENLLETNKINREHIIGVGVAISGVVDSDNGIMIRSVNLGWENVPVADILGEMLDLPVHVANDANAAALAEMWFGECQDSNSFLYIKTETGAGVGVVVERNLVSGPRWMAGEIGHVPLIKDGYQCRCGQVGCLETYVYINDVLKRYKQATGQSVDKLEFLKLAQDGDAAALDLVSHSAEAIAHAACSWGVLLDLDKVIIGGIWGLMQNEVIEPVRRLYLEILSKTGIHRDIKIMGSSLGEDSYLLGATGLVIHYWFTPHLHSL